MTSFNVIKHTHAKFLTPLVTRDDRSDFIHLILDNVVGLNTLLLEKTSGVVAEYHSRDGDIYPVISHQFGYIIERPKKEDQVVGVLQWINDELALSQGYLDTETFNALVPYKQVALAAKVELSQEAIDILSEQDGQKLTAQILVCVPQYAAPEGIHLPNGDVVPLGQLVSEGDTYGQGYVINLYEGTAEEFIETHLKHLVKTTVEVSAEQHQSIYLADSISPFMLQIN